ncbi:MAG: MIP/aquaporin family protein [Bacteroidota bacterium]
MEGFLGEFIGTTILLLLGNGVVANTLLKDTKGHGVGWMFINWGWGIAVFVAVFISAPYSGAHLNPAVTIGLAMAGKFAWSKVGYYILAQFLGAMFGALLVYFHYLDHYKVTKDFDAKLGTFFSGPAIRNLPMNFVNEMIGTFVLVYGVLYMVSGEGLGAINALPVGLLVFGIGMSLGGNSGYAINPARDIGPRLVHFILPLAGGKRNSDWTYAWVPMFGPLAGAAFAALLYGLL